MKAEDRARQTIGKMENTQLFESWEATGNADEHDVVTAMVRGWLMDEIEKRFPEAFDRWLDQDAPEDNELRAYCLG